MAPKKKKEAGETDIGVHVNAPLLNVRRHLTLAEVEEVDDAGEDVLHAAWVRVVRVQIAGRLKVDSKVDAHAGRVLDERQLLERLAVELVVSCAERRLDLGHVDVQDDLQRLNADKANHVRP